jgi:hypothetical protein
MSRQFQITIRVPADWVERLDKIADNISRPGLPASRADAVRFLVAQSLEKAEAEFEPKAPTKKARK